jgi:hypothetical protein
MIYRGIRFSAGPYRYAKVADRSMDEDDQSDDYTEDPPADDYDDQDDSYDCEAEARAALRRLADEDPEAFRRVVDEFADDMSSDDDGEEEAYRKRGLSLRRGPAQGEYRKGKHGEPMEKIDRSWKPQRYSRLRSTAAGLVLTSHPIS